MKNPKLDELKRLLNNDGDIPDVRLRFAKTPEGLYLNREDLLDMLSDLEEAAISDQKQEAYRGLRKLLKAFKG